jgi:hypothetical protein
MARLKYEKGQWTLQIHHQNSAELLKLISLNTGYYLENISNPHDTYLTYSILDYCQGDVYSITESEYREILAQISQIIELDERIEKPLPPECNQTIKELTGLYDGLSPQRQKMIMDFISDIATTPLSTEFKWNPARENYPLNNKDNEK